MTYVAYVLICKTEVIKHFLKCNKAVKNPYHTLQYYFFPSAFRLQDTGIHIVTSATSTNEP